MLLVASNLLKKAFMAFRARSRKIPVPDMPPVVNSSNYQRLVTAGLGLFCVSVVLAALLFVFFGA